MAESATATITATPDGANGFLYDITLNDTGTTTLGTFWFAWVPGEDFLDTEPANVVAPVGWTDAITHGAASDGYGIQWHVISTSADEVASGGTLSGFSFTSQDTPAQVFGNSVHFPASSVLTSFVYSGMPFSDAGFEFEATAACFCAGTLIATPGGPRAVETLAADDWVSLADGGAARLRWVGSRLVATRFADRMKVWPVRVRAGALGGGLPLRDLMLSSEHALLVDDLLVHAGALVNGTTIVRETALPERFTYYHLEVAGHALLLAEGAAAESFLDSGDAGRFDNWPSRVPPSMCAAELPYPRVKSPRQLPVALRRRLGIAPACAA